MDNFFFQQQQQLINDNHTRMFNQQHQAAHDQFVLEQMNRTNTTNSASSDSVSKEFEETQAWIESLRNSEPKRPEHKITLDTSAHEAHKKLAAEIEQEAAKIRAMFDSLR